MALISHRRAATAAQIGHALGMSAAAVRHHLSILAADGRIVIELVEPKGRRGRPEKTYRVSDRVLGENLDLLSDIVLRLWLDELPVSKRGLAIRAAGEKLSEQTGRTDQSLPAPKLLVQLIEKLNDLHYQARWEAGAQGPRILLGHCPYAAIIGLHPELCALDAGFLAAEMNADVEQLSKLDPGRAGASHCVFAVREATPAARSDDQYRDPKLS